MACAALTRSLLMIGAAVKIRKKKRNCRIIPRIKFARFAMHTLIHDLMTAIDVHSRWTIVEWTWSHWKTSYLVVNTCVIGYKWCRFPIRKLLRHSDSVSEIDMHIHAATLNTVFGVAMLMGMSATCRQHCCRHDSDNVGGGVSKSAWVLRMCHNDRKYNDISVFESVWDKILAWKVTYLSTFVQHKTVSWFSYKFSAQLFAQRIPVDLFREKLSFSWKKKLKLRISATLWEFLDNVSLC